MYGINYLLQYSYPVTSPATNNIIPPVSGVIISLCPTDPIFASLCDLNGGGIGIVIQDIIIIVVIVAIAFALVYLILGGFKWIMSQGEEESVKKARNTLIAALLGLVFIFLSFFLLGLVVHFFVPGFNLSQFTLPTI